VAILESAQKLRGGYYTPQLVSEFLARWAIHSSTTTVLEPSCGDGNIAIAAAERLLAVGASIRDVNKQLASVELDIEEADRASARLNDIGVGIGESPVVSADFFQYCRELLLTNTRFDVVIGNPPFIRYQHFDERYRKPAFEIMRSVGLKPTNLTNIWVPFVVSATLLLGDSGKLAMVLPAELMQVGYTAELRRFLADHYAAITIVTFRKLLFSGAQQEVVLLLASRKAIGRGGIDVVELDDDYQLAAFDFETHDQYALKSMDHSTEKWTQYYLSENEIQLLRRLTHDTPLLRFGDIASVDVGVVTGNNTFFIVNPELAEQTGISPYTVPVVGRSFQLPGLRYRDTDLAHDITANARCFLVYPPNEEKDALSPEMVTYLEKGEEQEVHKGYKCSIRKRWYIVPSVRTPDAFLFRQINRYPKLILNETAATSTDTIHRVRFREHEQAAPTVARFHNSMTFAFAEVMGRSYGGGVLELEPNEADNLPLPPFSGDDLSLESLDRQARAGRIDDMLEVADRLYLREQMGLPRADVEALRNIWEKLSNRRVSRTFKRRGQLPTDLGKIPDA